MLHKFIIPSICFIVLILCSFSSQKTKDKLEGKYVLLKGKSAYDSFSFKGKSTVVVEAFGMEFVTSYVKDEEYLRIESDPGNLLLKVQSKDTIIGEGVASGIYIKEPLRQQDLTFRQRTQDFEKSIDSTKAEKKRLVEKQGKKEQAISNKMTSAFGMGNKENNSQDKSEHETKKSVGGYGISLNGRSISAGGLPRPAYTSQEEGQIVVNITVDPKGNVIFAEIGKDTNIDNASMRKNAIDAAKRAKFNSINSANNQSGTITYLYKLK